MKRKKSKLIGLVLIISAVLLQVGYAATTVPGVVGTPDYAVQIESEKNEMETSPYVDVNVSADGTNRGVILVEANNLYPGAFFTINSFIKNVGKNPVKLTSVSLKSLEQGSAELYKNLIFYDKQGNEIAPANYQAYLDSMFPIGTFEAGKIVPYDLKIGLSKDVTELQDATTRFQIVWAYEQIVLPSDSNTGTGTGSSTGSSNTVNKAENVNPISPETTQAEDEIIPGGPAKTEEIPDENTPGGPTKTEIIDETIPGGPAKLPKTGGVSALFIYALGLAMLGCGIIVYRRSRKQE